MTNKIMSRADAFACVLSIIDQFDQQYGDVGDSCAIYVLGKCQPFFCDAFLGKLKHPRGYVSQATRRNCRRYFRRKRRVRLVLQSGGIADRASEDEHDVCELIWFIVHSLSNECTSSERICAEGLAAGLPKKKIAEQLSVSSGMITKLAKQVQEKMKKRIVTHDTVH